MPNDDIFILDINLITFVHNKKIKNIKKNRIGNFFRSEKNSPSHSNSHNSILIIPKTKSSSKSSPGVC